MTDDELFVDGVETPELDQFELDRRVMKIMEYVDAYANETATSAYYGLHHCRQTPGDARKLVGRAVDALASMATLK